MPPKTNPLKLNKLQARTLALAQVIARDPSLARTDEASGDVTILNLPRAHGDHVHVGPFVVSTRDISGFTNPAVWTALSRKGLARADDPVTVTLTRKGVDYDTGLGHMFQTPSDH
ncbi:MAG: hypothetical protein RIC16_11550 [Rhodospirillales bacterium]